MAADPPLNLEPEVGARVFMGWAEKAGGVYSGCLSLGPKGRKEMGHKRQSSLDGR